MTHSPRCWCSNVTCGTEACLIMKTITIMIKTKKVLYQNKNDKNKILILIMILFFSIFRFLSLTFTEETITRRWNAQQNFLYFKLLSNISSFKTLRNILTALNVFGCKISGMIATTFSLQGL